MEPKKEINVLLQQEFPDYSQKMFCLADKFGNMHTEIHDFEILTF